MSLKLSTGLRQYLLGGGCMREAFSDAILNIYSGPAPATADLPATGVCLVPITTGSVDVTHDAVNTPEYFTITIAHANDIPDVGDTVKLLVDSVEFNLDALGSGTVETLAIRVATELNAQFPQLEAIPSHATGVLYVRGKFAGVAVTLTDNSSGEGLTVTVVNGADAVPIATVKFATPSGGVIAKTGAWSGVVDYSGTAGYFRLVLTNDHDLDDSATAIRLQGNVSTSGAELNLSNINLVAGATETISTFRLTEPASKEE